MLSAKPNVDLRYEEMLVRFNMDPKTPAKIDSITTTKDLNIKADAFIVCAGPETPKLLQPLNITIPMLPFKGYTFNLRPKKPMKFDHNFIMKDRKMSVCHIEDDLIRVGFFGDIAGIDFSFFEERVRFAMESINDVFPDETFDKTNLQIWTGLRPNVPDDVPLIGATSRIPNLYVNIGHGGRGSTQSLGSSKLLSELVMQEKPSINAEHYSPKRYMV